MEEKSPNRSGVQDIQKLSEEIKKYGFEFRLIAQNPPKQKEIEFIGLEQLLFEELINKTPKELDPLSPSTIVVDEVSYLKIEEIVILNTNDINVRVTELSQYLFIMEVIKMERQWMILTPLHSRW